MKKTKLALCILCLASLVAIPLIYPDSIRQVRNRLGFSSSETGYHYRKMVALHSEADREAPPGAVIFIGDSHTQSLEVSSVSSVGVNFGIAGDTTVGVLQRLSGYESLSRAETIVLAIGINDFSFRANDEIASNIETILRSFPTNAKIILCALHPVVERIPLMKGYNARIQDLNRRLIEIGSGFKSLKYLDTFGQDAETMGREFLVDDGVHLNTKGYEVWGKKLSNALSENNTTASPKLIISR